ncbi:uncharacterized protein EI97DRAFT_464914 [Westerdykella ornata]|uniref:RING-type domain-containing protein n=1 Tax=Westerdykella ornata TaxID=318751 RepID=A0A6A6JU04_WESOR|nr:uncharacterized protein EI97DRAFT_464914 [Westerdykella ornata]KAF2279714.1 hypothetical protein EI97DRAFT_464914 [Westerdykella ornata]
MLIGRKKPATHGRRVCFSTTRHLIDQPCNNVAGKAVLRRVETLEQIQINRELPFWRTDDVFMTAFAVGRDPDRALQHCRAITPYDFGESFSLSESQDALDGGGKPIAAAEQCSICLEFSQGNDKFLRTRKCSHIFCADCLTKWADEGLDINEASPKCPYCRQAIDMVDPDERFVIWSASGQVARISMRKALTWRMADKCRVAMMSSTDEDFAKRVRRHRRIGDAFSDSSHQAHPSPSFEAVEQQDQLASDEMEVEEDDSYEESEEDSEEVSEEDFDEQSRSEFGDGYFNEARP